MNLSLPEGEVRRLCLAQGVSISVIEPLQSGGTRLVCTAITGAEEMRLRLRGHRRHPAPLLPPTIVALNPTRW